MNDNQAVSIADVAVIGGGVMGCSVAMHLASLAGAGTRIVVVERDPSYRDCATTRSAGGVRQQFSTPECIAMSQATVAYVKGKEDLLAFREQGYLLLASEVGRATLTENAALQRAHGADTLFLAPADLAARFPWLDVGNIAGGGLGASGEGWLDPALLLQHLKSEARALGVMFRAGSVNAIERMANRIVSVQLADGSQIAAGHVVNCAGPASGAVARLASVDLPVEARKRFVFVFDCREAPPIFNTAPLVVDPSGVWFRPEGLQFICGVSPACDVDEPAPADLGEIDYDLFQDRIWPVLAARVPAFAAVKLTGAWAGHYDTNTLDHNAVIGPHDEVANLHFCSGFSGHGLQHAIAAGRAVAERIVNGRFVTLDLARLGYDRVRQHLPLVEHNVI